MLASMGQEHRAMIKYGFKIRTRGGMVVDNLTIPGRDQQDAERKLQQIYRHCEILEARPVHHGAREDAVDVDGILSLISRQR